MNVSRITLAFLNEDDILVSTTKIEAETVLGTLSVPEKDTILRVYSPRDGNVDDVPWPFQRWRVHEVERSAFIGGREHGLGEDCTVWLKPYQGVLPELTRKG